MDSFPCHSSKRRQANGREHFKIYRTGIINDRFTSSNLITMLFVSCYKYLFHIYCWPQS